MYIPFNIKSDYSIMHSMIKIKDLVLFAKENNLKALTLTDDNLFGAIEFYKECKNNNIKPIIGINIKKNDLDIILYAMNYNGYQELIKIINEYRENNIVDLNKSNNILCIIPYESRSLYKELKEYYSELYVTYKNEEEKNKINLNNKLYMNEILYLKKELSETYKYFKSYKKELIDIEYDNELKLDVEDNSHMYDKFNLELKHYDNLLPQIDDAYNKLKEECKLGLKKRFGDKVGSKYLDRIKYELEVINDMGFSNYFLIVSDYVKYAKNSNILVGPGRGSAVGSLVSYVLEITNVDPLKYGLLFERFLNKNRITMPDIDIDFDALKREEVIKYCVNKYGNKNVAGIITFSTLGLKQAIKEIGPNIVPESDVNYLLNLVELNDLKNLKNLEELNKLYNIALSLTGLKTNMSVNASGIVICNKSLDEIVPLERHNDMYLIGHTMNYLEDVGLLKMDFLALKNLSTINKILEKVKININEIPLNDIKTFEIFNKSNTNGIFQFETAGMKEVLKKFKITSFDDIYNLSALFRPGPKDNIDSYINRKLGKEKIDYLDPSLEKIIKPTYGIIIYQEQIMQIAQVLADYSLGEADILRRAMSKKKNEILISEKEKFVSRAIKNGYKLEIVEKIYDYILKFAEYGFNKSHSVAYALISYQMAYLKANYKEEFMITLLEENSTINIKDSINECKKNNIKLITPIVNKTKNKYEIDDGIVLPLNICSLNNGVINNIIENMPYSDIYDFLTKTDNKLVNKNVLLNLIKIGYFDSFMNRKTLINNLDNIFNYIELYKELGVENKPTIEIYDEYNKLELIKMEYEVFNCYINNNPIEEYRKKLNKGKTINTLTSFLNRKVEIIVSIDTIKEIKTKDNKKMCFINVSDTYGKLEVVIFNDIYNNIPKIKVNDIVLIYGKVSKRNGEIQIILDSLRKIEE